MAWERVAAKWGGVGLTARVAFLMLGPPAVFAQFVPAPVDLPAASAGSVAWGDYDNDGRLDLLLSGSLSISLWKNTGGGFSNVTAAVAPGLPGLYDSAIAWGDFDNDGRLDLLLTGLTNFSGGAVAGVWRNTGSQFTNVPIPGLVGVGESSVSWGDFDGDGRLDFLIAGTSNGVSSGAIAQLWRNTGTGFTNVPIPGLTGSYFGSLAAADFDNDGRLDFLITGISDSSTGDAITQLWRNTGTGFSNVPIPGLRGVYVSSTAWGDYDGDGRLDFLLEGLDANKFLSQLWRNTGNGFTNVPIPGLPGIADGSLAWGDYDGDGRLDFLITGLTNGATEFSQIWRNTGSGFTNVPIAGFPGSFDNAVGWGDYDNDGHLDVLLSGIQGSLASQLWRNTATQTASLPVPPSSLSSAASADSVRLAWTPPAGESSGALTFNLRVGTSTGGVDIISPEADPATARRRVAALGNLGENLSVTLHLPPGDYFWSVQSIDGAFAGSSFAPEQHFQIGILLHSIPNPDGAFQFSFFGMPGYLYVAQATTNVPAAGTVWTTLGTVPEVAPGRFQFADPQATFLRQRFYRVLGR